MQFWPEKCNTQGRRWKEELLYYRRNYIKEGRRWIIFIQWTVYVCTVGPDVCRLYIHMSLHTYTLELSKNMKLPLWQTDKFTRSIMRYCRHRKVSRLIFFPPFRQLNWLATPLSRSQLQTFSLLTLKMSWAKNDYHDQKLNINRQKNFIDNFMPGANLPYLIHPQMTWCQSKSALKNNKSFQKLFIPC